MRQQDRWSATVAGVAVVCWSFGLGGLVVAFTSGQTFGVLAGLSDRLWPIRRWRCSCRTYARHVVGPR